ncbi:MAG TPA: competence/damage-inducible protein A [Solirubrobacterales bacterium]|nr:competence/damage-inducible protein A [Solirubrobacterales bacterium]
MTSGTEIFRSGSSSDGEVRAGILVTGTEVLTATIRDENGPWLSRQLSDLGVELIEILVVADHPGDLINGLEHMKSTGVDLIITTGGLGPTADDLTAEVVAAFAGRAMKLDEGMERQIAKILARFAASTKMDLSAEALNEANRKQAMIPVGAVALDPIGTAPGLIVPGQEAGDPLVLVLPGPPRELKPMWEAALREPLLREVIDRATRLRKMRLRMFGTPESELALSLREIEDDGLPFDGLEITTCLRKGEVEVDVRYRDAAADAAVRLRDELKARHNRSLYSLDGRTVDEVVAGLLAGRRLGLAESCSAGLLGARIADVPGSSEYFAGGVISYSNEAKRDMLGVDQALLDEFGAVSAEVAEAMAIGAMERFDANVAISITGVAGPGGGSEEKPVGLVHFNVRTAEGGVRAAAPVIPGGRRDVRERSALVGMHLLREMLV